MKRFYTLLIALIGAVSALMASDYTQLYLVGASTNWAHLPEYELKTTDGDYYVATYPSGSELELSNLFKLSDPTWRIYNFGGNMQIEAGKSYTLISVGDNLSPVGIIKISKIEFTVSTATLIITGDTEENKFDITTDQKVSLVDINSSRENFYRLDFQGNGVYTGTYKVPEGDFYFKVGGDGNFNVIDYGYNGDYIILNEPYILQKGSLQYAAVKSNDVSWVVGDKFDVEVTFAEDWTATLLLTKKSDLPNPEPGPTPGPTPTPDPTPGHTPEPGFVYLLSTPTDNFSGVFGYTPNLEDPDIENEEDQETKLLKPEKIEETIYGYNFYKFKTTSDEGIRFWTETCDSRFGCIPFYLDTNVAEEPYFANDVWYKSINDMKKWYVYYSHKEIKEAFEMKEIEPGLFACTINSFEEKSVYDSYCFCLGSCEDPIIQVGEGITKTYDFMIPEGLKATFYLDTNNWQEEWVTYYKLDPITDSWDNSYLDLGLSSGLCWSTKNLGAKSVELEGDYFAWGEVNTKKNYSFETYKWSLADSWGEYTKYITDAGYGVPDFKTTLEAKDDAANAILGGKWHIPTKADVEELLEECKIESAEIYGVDGYLVTGPNGNIIFIPITGSKKGSKYNEAGSSCSYWTSIIDEDDPEDAITMNLGLTGMKVGYNDRFIGLNIRPVIHRDYVAIDEVPAIKVFANEGTIYAEVDFEIYNLTGINVTSQNGTLKGIYIVKTSVGNRLISVY